jgi:DNA-binding NarL/FixJ family response regulator
MRTAILTSELKHTVTHLIPVVVFCSSPSLTAMLSDYFERREAARVQHAADLVESLHAARTALSDAEVAVVALRIPIAEDLELVHRIRCEFPDIGIVALAPVCSGDYTNTVKEAGVDALVDVGRLGRDLIPAVKSAARRKGSA